MKEQEVIDIIIKAFEKDGKIISMHRYQNGKWLKITALDKEIFYITIVKEKMQK